LRDACPRQLEVTALTIYGTVRIGAATALLIIASGQIYSRVGAYGFWVMATLCALALPLRSLKVRGCLRFARARVREPGG
jgi:hypothetical protein